MKNTETKQKTKQKWGPFLKTVVAPNVPWLWKIGNLVINMSMVNLMIEGMMLSSQIMGGEIFDNALLFRYVGINLLSLAVGVGVAISDSCAEYWMEQKIQRKLWKKMVRIPMRLYDRQSPSSLISRFTSDTTQITYAISYVFSIITTTYATFNLLKQIWGMNSSIAKSLLLVIPYIVLVMVVPGRFKFRVSERVQGTLSNFTTFVAERLASITLVKSSADEDNDLQVGYAAAESCFKADLRAALLDCAVQPFTSSTEGIIQAVVLISGSFLVQGGELEMADLIAMYMFSSSIYRNLSQYIFCFHHLKNAQGATAKITELMSSEPEVLEREKSFTQPDDDIALEDVCFRYDEQEVLKDVTVIIPKGKVTAIVGPSGAGKTTLLSLLERLYQPNGGCLKFGGTPVEKFHLNQWRGATGYIQQNSPLLSGTIRENICYGLDREATDDQMIEAAKKANAYDFIMKLPQGFDTEVGQLGGKLSGGERQRIAIARMIIKDPDYLFLDEATSNLDAENEAAVQAALNQVMKGKTAVVVAHNLRTIVNADNIVVMDQGKVQAVGTHQSLYKTDPLYTKYFDLQFAQ